MATYAAKVRDTAIDGRTIKLRDGRMYSTTVMEPFNAPSDNSIFYVDGNRSNTGDGKTWQSAFKTLAEGLLAAHTYQGTSANRAWAHRATVYVCGDDLDEDLTLLSEKTDVVGVGSANSRSGPRLYGNHVIQASATDNYNGCRFYNFSFQPQAAGITWDIPTGHHGIGWTNCVWEWAAASTTGIRITACQDTLIQGCRFTKGSGTGYSTAAISIATGASSQTQILDNYIDANIGITIHAGTTGEGNLIQGNTIIAVGLTIDDNSDLWYVVDNRCISEAALGASSYDFSTAKSAGNIVTGSDNTLDVPIKAV